jgi:hypothetical protein
MNIQHPYCKGDCLIPIRYSALSEMPYPFIDTWPLTLEVLAHD